MWAAGRLSLSDPYWAGISAVIASAGTLGASLSASISRVSATIVGLIVGIGVVALPVGGVLISGLAVFVALVAMAMLSLDTGARLGAATTLIVTATPHSSAVTTALTRGANVPLGCAVAVAVGLVLWPHRAADQLRSALPADAQRAGALIQSALLRYFGAGTGDELMTETGKLTRRKAERAALLRDAAREPALAGDRLRDLRRDEAILGELIDATASLVPTCMEGPGDGGSTLLQTELGNVAAAIAATTRAVGRDRDADRLRDSLARLKSTCSELDAAFARARASRSTAALRTAELGQLLSVIRGVHRVSSALARFQ